MKKLIVKASVLAVLVVLGCSKTETDLVSPAGKEGVALSVSTGVKTKAVVEGKAVTYDKQAYATAAKGLGIVLLNKEGNALYQPDNATDYPAGTPVWFMGDETGKNWTAISAKGGSFDDATGRPCYLTETVGRVYAWYPYSAIFEGNMEAGLNVNVSVAATGMIDASSLNNAEVVWDETNKVWKANNEGQAKIIAGQDEADFLYFAGGTSGGVVGRYVNNGRGTGSISNNNTDAVNPGCKISLQMEHAMSMVSFRVYNDGTLDGELELTKIVVQNMPGGNGVLQTGGIPVMALSDGKITGISSGSNTLTRTVSGYTLVRQVTTGSTEDAGHFVESNGSPTVSGKAVARKVSLIVFPIAAIASGDLGAELTVGGKKYIARIPAGIWAAGKNVVYTVRASSSSLEIVEVSLTPWEDVDGGDINI